MLKFKNPQAGFALDQTINKQGKVATLAWLAAALARAAADPGLDEEVGALRLTLARLLREEEADPLKVATAVARLAAVGVQAARTRRALAEDGPDELLAAVESWLEE